MHDECERLASEMIGRFLGWTPEEVAEDASHDVEDCAALLRVYGERRERAGREAAAVVCDEVYREYGEAVRSTDTPAGHEAMKNKAAGAGECACRIRGGPESTP
jgi:hypothetical protein